MNNFILKNKKTLSIIGHIIISNQQIHNYQIRYIKEFLDKNNLLEYYSFIEDILSGNKDAISLKESVFCFNSEKIETRRYYYRELVVIAKLDGNLDKYENDILHQLNITSYEIETLVNEGIMISNDYILRYQEEDKYKREKLYRLPEELEIIKNLTERIKNVFIKSNLRLKEPDKQDNYLEISNEILRIGKEDYEMVKPIYKELLEQTQKIYNVLNNNLKDMEGKLVIEEELKETFSKTSDFIVENIIDRINYTFDEFYKKENALAYFTISLLGRTKAGKTTLHTILTGEGKESIGVGKQRTTRYNRVYQWNNLRLIDTPGIGAAEADGRTDEEIAESVIGESDIVCIVVSDDNVQEYIFNLAEKIINRNKPVIILLNHKENIKHPVRYKLFKKDPYRWISSGNTDGVFGHIQRIYDYAKREKFEDMIKPYPVFLLPAFMAMDEEYQDDRTTLIDASNLNEFQDGIKNTILTVGVLLRSQTIIDDSRALFAEFRDKLNSSIENLNYTYNKLNTSKNTIMKKLNRSQKKLLEDCRNILKESYFDLENNYALHFAEENYNSKNIEKCWQKYMKEVKFNEHLNEKLEISFNEFANEVQDIAVEILEDFKISMEHYMSLNDIDIPFLNINFRKAGVLLSGLGGIAGVVLLLLSNPVGWVVGGISSVVGLLSGLFKSKGAKRQEAIDKLYNNLKESIKKDKSKNIKKILKEIKNVSSNEIFKIEDLLNNLIEGLNYIINLGKDILKAYDNNIKLLDLFYSWRIFNYLSDAKIEKSQIEDIILDVEREFGKYINLKVNYDGNFKDYSDNLIREKINIIKV